MKLKIRFLRVNERHHTVAIASVNRLPLNPTRTRMYRACHRCPVFTREGEG